MVRNGLTEKFKGRYRVDSARLKGFDYAGEGVYFVTICTKQREYFFGDVRAGQMELSDVGRMADYFWREIPNHFNFVRLDEWVVMPNHLHGLIEIRNHNHNCHNRRDVALPRLGKSENIDLQMNALIPFSDKEIPGEIMCLGRDEILPIGKYETVPFVRVDNMNDDCVVYRDEVVPFGRVSNMQDDCVVHRDEAVPRLYGYGGDYPGMSEMSPKPGSLSVIVGSFKSVVTKNARISELGYTIWQPRFYDHIVRNEGELQRIRNYIINNPEKWDQDRNNQTNLWM